MKNTAILVVSCDHYADLWPPFFRCFWKYWPDCPFPVYLGRGTAEFNDPRVRHVYAGKDVSYSDNLLAMLERIPEEWVIFWVEDRIISARVDTNRVQQLVADAQRRSAAYLKLIPEHPLAYGEKAGMLGPVPKGTSYRVSMTIALWQKRSLRALLRRGETAWEIERKGSGRSNAQDAAYLALTPSQRRSPPIAHVHIIAKGKLLRDSRVFLAREGLAESLARRDIETWGNFLYSRLYHIYFRIVRPIQWWLLAARNYTGRR